MLKALNRTFDIEAELRTWRTNTINALLIITGIAATPMIVITTSEAIRHPEQWSAALGFLAMYLLLAGLAIFRRLSFRLRAWGFLLMIYAAGALAFARGGLAGDGRMYLLALPVLSLILINLRAGVAMSFLSLLTFAIFAVTAHFGWMADWLVRQSNTLLLSDWINGEIAFTLTLTTLMTIQQQFSQFQKSVADTNVCLYEESRKLQAFNENIVQSMQEGILLSDAAGHVTFINPRTVALLSYTSEDDLIGQDWIAIVAPEHQPEIEREIARWRQGTFSQCEIVLSARDGRRVPVIASVQPMLDDSGQFTSALFVFTDITEYKQAAEALRESQEMAQALLDATTESVFLCDAQGTLLTLNQTAAQRFGKSVDELIGSRILELLPPDLIDSRGTVFDEIIRSGKLVRFEDEWAGSLFDINVYPILNVHGEVARLAIFAQDTTERRKAERQAARNERLAAIGRLAAGLAHEINNPLQSILSNLELVTDFDLEPDEREEYLSAVYQEFERLTELTQRILDFAHPSPETLYPIQLTKLVQRTLALTVRQLQNAKVQVKTDFPPDLPPVFVVPNQVIQVFINLIINAIEVMPRGGHLHIAAHADEDMVSLTFTNDGPPLSEKHIGLIFDPFFTTKPNGIGLGLSISYSIVKQYGGEISVDNLANGQGVVFTVTLPISHLSEKQEMIT